MDSPPKEEDLLGGRPPKAARRSGAEYHSRPALASAGLPAPNKALLRHVEDVWLFEIREGNRASYYTVERGDYVWPFSMFYTAQSKFEREVAKGGRE